MAIMIAEVYDALLEAGASQEKARKAAEVLAGFENRFAKIESDLTLLKWMVGTNVIITLAVFAKLIMPTA